MRGLLLIERPEDVPFASEDGPEEAVISLAPEAALELERRGVPYRILEDFTPAEEFVREAMERYRFLDRMVEDLDDRMRKAVPELKEFDIRPASASYHALKVFLDGLAMKAQLLVNAFKALEPDEARFMPSKPGDFGPELFFENESLFSRLMPAAAEASGIKPVPLGPEASFVPEMAQRRRLYLLRPSQWPTLLAKVRARAAKLLLRKPDAFRPGADPRPLALTLYDAHDIPSLTEELGRRGFETAPVPFDHSDLARLRTADPEAARSEGEARAASERLWEELDGDRTWRRSFVFHGVDAYPAARERLARFVSRSPSEALLAARAWKRSFQTRKPACVLTCSSLVGHVGHAIFAAARRAGAPIIGFQEGAGFGVPYCPIYDHTDMRVFDLFLSYGEGTARHLEESGVRPKGVVRETGSTRLESLRPRLAARSESSHLYLYVPTTLHGRVQHAPYNGGTASYYFEAQKKLITALSRFPNIELVVKQPTGPGSQAMKGWVALSKTRGACRVVDNVPLTRLIPEAEGFITDFPSTTLLEMLMTDKPVFLLIDPYLTRLEPAAEAVLRKRASISGSVRELESAFERHLGGERLADSRDPEARRWFATHLDDGRCLERACEAVLEACGSPLKGPA